MSATAPTPAATLPAPDARTLGTVLLSGSVATIAFDLFGQSLSPLAGFASLAPVPLATQVWEVFSGDSVPAMGHLLHYVAGLVAYPVGWLFLARPVLGRVAPALPWWAAASIYGVGLWIFALFFMASLIAGNPPFLGFTGITWVALVGHVLFALVAAWIARRRGL